MNAPYRYDYDRSTRQVFAARVPLTPQTIRDVQKEAEDLASKAALLTDAAGHAALQQASYAWRNVRKPLYDEAMAFVVGIADEMSDQKKAKALVNQWRKKFAPLFEVTTSVSSMPDWEYWPRIGASWIREVRTKTEALSDVITFLGTLAKKKMTPQVHELTTERQRIEGFQVLVMEFDPSNADHVEALEKVREGLKQYRRKAAATLPLLLKEQVPFRLTFHVKGTLWGSAGNYGDSIIYIQPFNVPSPSLFVKTMAHEMGHHLFRTWLTDAKKNFWRGALAKDWTELDLGEVLAAWKSRAEYWATFMTDLMKTDPILYLQLEGALDHSRTMPAELRDDGWSRENLERYLAGGGKKTIRVPASPITAYATTNAEEAFCEAVGSLVAYGPRAVLPLVREWLRVIFGGAVKLAYASAASK